MTSKNYNSAMLSQIRNSVVDLNEINRTLTFEYLADCFPIEEIKKVRNVILTGCGDSYFAAIAAKSVYENMESFKGTGMIPGTPTAAMRNIEFSRYFNKDLGWEPMTVPSFLVGAISISGSPARPIEAIMRMNKVGGNTVAFTDNLNSDLAKEAKHVIKLNVPAGEYPAPNVTSYYASTFALLMFGLYLSYAKGQISYDSAVDQRNELMKYINCYAGEVQQGIEEKALALAEEWEKNNEIDVMDFIGDGPDYATALFGSAKMVESFGGIVTHDDTEDWCHINFFIRKPERIATFVIANSTSPSYGRAKETIETACSLGRKVVVITDSESSEFPNKATVFTLPKPSIKWANPLMQHLPMDYIAGYIGAIRKAAPFRIGCESHSADPECARFRKSKIEII